MKTLLRDHNHESKNSLTIKKFDEYQQVNRENKELIALI